MEQIEPSAPVRLPVVDGLTLIAVSAFAYISAIGLHELLGHAGACLALGNRLTEVNAFYVNCDYANMRDADVRLFFLAGPLVSAVLGFVSWFASRLGGPCPCRTDPDRPHQQCPQICAGRRQDRGGRRSRPQSMGP